MKGAPFFHRSVPSLAIGKKEENFLPKNLARKIAGFNNDVLVKSHWNDGFVKSSPATGETKARKN